MTKLQDYKLTLNQVGTDAVTILALRHYDAAKAINKAHRVCGKGWYVVTIEG